MNRTSALRPKCVVFDIDDTLYLERDYVRSGFRAVGDWVQQSLGLPSFYEEAWTCFETGLRRQIFNTVLEKRNVKVDAELVAQLIDVYRAHIPEITLLPDSESCLRELDGKAFLGVISDGAVRGQQNKVIRLGLESKFQKIFLTESFGVTFSKPHSKAFIEMQLQANCAGEECVYVADNPLKDFIAPNSLGWQTYRVRRRQGIYSEFEPELHGRPSFELEDLSSLCDLLSCH